MSSVPIPMTQIEPSMLMLVHSAKQIVRVASNKESCLKGTDAKSLSILVGKQGDGLSIVVDK